MLNDENNGIVVFLKNENLLLKTKLNSFPRLFFFFFARVLNFGVAHVLLPPDLGQQES